MRGFLLGVTLLTVAAVAFLVCSETDAPPLSLSADHIVVVKHDHTMLLYHGATLLRTYHVALGRGGLGTKSRAGDNRVPEGNYRIVGHNAHSAYHLALRVGYPTAAQTAEARAKGVDPGGDIMIHGIRNGLGWLGVLQRKADWTKGCIAVTDDEMDQVFRTVPDGARIDIWP